MGLFDKVFGSSQPQKLNAQEAFTGVLIASVASDGSIGSEEMLGVISVIARMKLYKGMNDQQIKAMMDRVVNVLKKQGPGSIISAAKETLSPDQKETAFAVAADLVLADGVVEAEEKQFLEDLQKAMEVADDKALKITEVLVIKNRG